MNEITLIYKNYFDTTIEKASTLVARFLDELTWIKPKVELKVEVSENKEMWKGYFLEFQMHQEEYIHGGLVEITRVYEKSETPVEVKIFKGHYSYRIWILNLVFLFEKYLKLSDGQPPPTVEYWVLIPDHGYDRTMVKLWYEGYTAQGIGNRIHAAPQTVYNRLSKLRKMYGDEIVPYRRSKTPKIK